MRAAIALGSNLPSPFGDPAANLGEAVRRLAAVGTVLAVSPLHRTEPVGYTEQPWFTNAAALLHTERAPLPLLQALLEIERSMGRRRAVDTPPKGPRIIDLDLLLCADEEGRNLIVETPELTLPHPELAHRAFVLEPLAQIAPAMTVPPEDCTVATLWSRLQRNAAME